MRPRGESASVAGDRQIRGAPAWLDPSRSTTVERLSLMLENSSDLITLLDADGRVVGIAGAVEAISADADDLAGMRFQELLHPDDAESAAELLRELGEQPGGSARAEWRVHLRDGSWASAETVAVNRLDDRELSALVLTTRDISERSRTERHFRHEALHDPLTQLSNRAAFFDRVEAALARQVGTDELIALLFVDVDDFKLVNDRYGHAAGDQFIVRVAQRLRGCVRSPDTVARLGGDEFGVLLEGIGGESEPIWIAEQILSAFSDPVPLGGDSVPIGVSVGIALSGATTLGADDLLRQADLAMSASKRDGKGRYELFETGSPVSDPAATPEVGSTSPDPARLSWFRRAEEQRAEIGSLLARPDGIRCVFQPILDLTRGTVTAYEALVRFAVPIERPASSWISQAHRCGLGCALEARAVEEALAAPGRPSGALLSVNASPVALASPEMQEVLPKSLEGLMIEITEHELIAENAAGRPAISAARDRGAQLAIDDAGSGYAGLQQLMRLMPDMIKLDRGLVDGAHRDLAKAALIESFVRFADRIKATVCAEGIESLEDLELIRELGVQYAQGFAIAVPAEAWSGVPEGIEQLTGGSLDGELPKAALLLTGHELEQRLRSASTTDELNAIMGSVSAIMGADETYLSTLDPDATFVEMVAGHGFPQLGARYSLDAYPATALVLEERRPQWVRVDDADADPREVELLLAQGIRSMLMVPVIDRGRSVGLLEIYSRRYRPWNGEEIARAEEICALIGRVVMGLERSAPASSVSELTPPIDLVRRRIGLTP